jgi:fumarylacetoacetase
MANHWSDAMTEVDHTHAIDLESWFEPANRVKTDFPIQNLPLGMYRIAGSNDAFRACTAIGDHILDLAAVDAVYTENLNELAASGRTTWRQLRSDLSQALSDTSRRSQVERFLTPLDQVELGLPVLSRDFTDFFTSYFHAYNAGKLFRPDDPLTPNFKWMPIAYHGRASSIVLSGTAVRRPWGQIMTPDSSQPTFAPSRFVDFETELGFVIGPGTGFGDAVAIDQAEDHLFGVVLLNDWSARDIQAWEYQPLGPFLAKSFATTISPWIVTMEALAPFRVPAFKRFEGDPPPLPHLRSTANDRSGHVSINVEAHIKPALGSLQRLSRANYSSSYWNPAQLVAHHTSNGCPLNTGDLLGTGTISGPTDGEAGALLELGKMGQTPVVLEDGSTRTSLADGDVLTLRGGCEREGFRSIGFGEAAGAVMPAVPA